MRIPDCRERDRPVSTRKVALILLKIKRG